jgi:Ca-activated chloride channel family protein
MSFIWPILLVLLLLVPIGALLALRIEQSRRRRAAQLGSLGIAQTPTGRALGWRRRVPPALFLAGFTVMLVALARPQAVVSLPRLEGTVILAFDVSGSMAATDFQPTRMDAAKKAAKAFVAEQPQGVAIGVVAFSDGGLAVQVPTTETATVLSAIDRLAPQRGTSLGQGLLTSLNAIIVAEDGPANGYYTNRSPAPSDQPPQRQNKDSAAVIVLLSDGENNERPDPIAAAQAIADQGVHIETVGIGSPEGTTLDINGFRVHTALNEDLLKQLASMTGGEYHAAATEPDLQKIYQTIGQHLVVKPEEMEVTSLFAGAGIAFLVLGGLLSLRWMGRVL